MPADFYVYQLSRPNGEPFYIGMGSGDRINFHEKKAQRGDRSHKSNIIRKIIASGESVVKTVLGRFACAHDAKIAERKWIARLGRRDLGTGPLVNHTAGGDGATGWSDALRRKHSIATRIGMSNPSTRAKCREHALQQFSDPDMKEKLVGQLAFYWADEDNRAKQAERVRTYPSRDPDGYARHLEARRRALRSPETREKMAAAKRGKKQSPEQVAKRAASHRGKKHRPGTGARISAAKKAAFQKRRQEAMANQ